MLTVEQFVWIGKKLYDKKTDVVQLAKNSFNHEWNQEDSAELEKISKVFLCENCKTWVDSADRNLLNPKVCDECFSQ